jgi:hypothetical protein
MSARHSTLRSPREHGAVNLIAAMFLFTVIMAVLGTLFVMTATDIFDSKLQSDSVKALLLAESAVERAQGRLVLGTACASLSPDSGTQGSGNFSVTSPSVSGSNCLFTASGTVGNVTRTLSVQAGIPAGGSPGAQTLGWTWSTGNNNKWAYAAVALRPSASAITAGAVPSPVTGAGVSRTLSYTVSAGASILLAGISVDQATANITMTYGGTAMTSAVIAVGVNPWPKAQIFYLINPPAGTANIVANMSVSSEAVLGAIAFSNVNVSTGGTAPFDVTPVTSTGNSRAASLTITPATSGAWVFDTLSINANDVTTMTAMTNRISRWNTNSNGNVRGDASTMGPINSAGGGTTSSLVSWTEVINN